VAPPEPPPDFQPQEESTADEMFDADADEPPATDAAPERSSARGPGYFVAHAIAAILGLTLAYLLFHWFWR
jgi:hypothetical protein